jgi:hypothetical protein
MNAAVDQQNVIFNLMSVVSLYRKSLPPPLRAEFLKPYQWLLSAAPLNARLRRNVGELRCLVLFIIRFL